MPGHSLPGDFCQQFTTVEASVLLCTCEDSSCNGVESGAELLAGADKTTTELPAGVGIKCFQCAGKDDKCSNEDDGGSIQACDADVETCTITKLVDKTSGDVIIILLFNKVT